MKMNRIQLEDSDDDMDLPLKYLSSDYKNEKSIKELKRYSLQTCEFCEKTFENRYDHLVHNGKHIIIPLIKTSPYHCAECSLYYLTEEEINNHMSVKHKTVIKPKSINNDNFKNQVPDICTFEIEDTDEETDEDKKSLSYLVKKEKDERIVQNNKKDILENFLMNCKVDVENVIWRRKSDEVDHKSNNLVNFKPSTKPNTIMNKHTVRLRNSAEEKIVIKNEDHEFKTASDASSEFSDVNDDDPIVILRPVKKENLNIHSRQDSIHFGDLMRPGIFCCKLCSKRFPNRYEVIIHETVHMEISIARESCKKKRKIRSANVHTIALGSKQDYEHSKHVTTCGRCHEEITDINLHAKTCRLHLDCGNTFNNRTVLTPHKNKRNKEVIVNICDACLNSKSRPEHLKCYGTVIFPHPKAKLMCDWCGELSKNISLVSLPNRESIVDRIIFEDDLVEWDTKTTKIIPREQIVSRGRRRRGRGCGPKTRSNWDRLKIIQNRLKMMKK